MPDQQLKERYRARNGDSADIKEGLKHAGDQGWLSYEPTTRIWHLTELRHESAWRALSIPRKESRQIFS
jgi:hypothetical protein